MRRQKPIFQEISLPAQMANIRVLSAGLFYNNSTARMNGSSTKQTLERDVSVGLEGEKPHETRKLQHLPHMSQRYTDISTTSKTGNTHITLRRHHTHSTPTKSGIDIVHKGPHLICSCFHSALVVQCNTYCRVPGILECFSFLLSH